MDKPQTIALIEKNVNYSIFDVKWIPATAKFVVCGSKPKGGGIIEIYELEEEKAELVKEIDVERSLRCCTFGASSISDGHIAVGDFTGQLSVM